MNQEQEQTTEQTTEQTAKKQKEEQQRKLSEKVTFKVSQDLDKYLLYMIIILTLETFLQKKEDGVITTNREDVENIITSWTENFRTAISKLIEKDPAESKQITVTALNAAVNSTRDKLFNIITATSKMEKEPEKKETGETDDKKV